MSTAAGPRRRSPQSFTIPVVVVGLLVAGVQGLFAVSRLFGLSLLDVSGLEGEDFAVAVSMDDYVRAALWSLPNVGLCLLVLLATLVAVRSHARSPARLAWACVGVIVTVGVLTVLGQPSWPGGEI